MLGHNLLGSFLGLLLVFRQNTAYSRFWDARCIWSTAAASCRAMAVSLVTQIRPHAPTSTETLLTLVAAFPDALAFTCLGGSYTLAHNVKKLVIPRAGIQTRLAPATVLCVMLQETIHACAQEFDRREPGSRGQLENLHLLGLSHEVDVLASSLKTCQRILNTPVPWSYSRHTSRFLTIYAATLPLAVVSTLGWLTIPVMTVLSWCLFGIEEIGHLIEQPFVGSGKTTRARMTEPYDIGLPVFILSNQARLEVEAIAAIQPKQHFL
jgi:predicted membrane chloride channel (bestrophin family)